MCLKLPPNDPAILGNFENKNDLKQVSKYALQQRKIKPNRNIVFFILCLCRIYGQKLCSPGSHIITNQDTVVTIVMEYPLCFCSHGTEERYCNTSESNSRGKGNNINVHKTYIFDKF